MGDDHPETLRSANNLATDLHALGEYQQARALKEQIVSYQTRPAKTSEP